MGIVGEDVWIEAKDKENVRKSENNSFFNVFCLSLDRSRPRTEKRTTDRGTDRLHSSARSLAWRLFLDHCRPLLVPSREPD